MTSMQQYLTLPDGTIPPGVDVAALEAAGIRLVRPIKPPQESGMVAVEIDPEMRDGAWWQTWTLEPAPALIVDPADVRADRDARLAASDWTQLADVPLSSDQRAAWAAYRQALREVTDQAGFPGDVAWPSAPGD